jgi:DNA-binding response OmpR family regulator
MTALRNSPGIGTGSFLVLVVDDEATMRRSLADILRLEGYHVQMAESGEEAIQRLKNETYDLILLDLKMPGMSGVEVLRFAAGISPETQVILLTAHGSLESAIEALRLGAQDYILKPSSPEMILASVAKALKSRVENLQNQELLSRLESSVQTLKGNKETDLPVSRQRNVVFIDNRVRIDFDQRVVWDEDERASLTFLESKLMKIMLENRDHVFTHRELVAKVQGYDITKQESPAVLRPWISRLRRKLSIFPGGLSWIINVRGIGYALNPGIAGLSQESRKRYCYLKDRIRTAHQGRVNR